MVSRAGGVALGRWLPRMTREALSDRAAATSSKATSESACSFHNDGEFSARLSSSSSVVMRATTATMRNSTRATLPRELFSSRYSALHASASARSQCEIEKPHGNHLAEFRVGHAHEYPDGFLDLADLGLFGGNLLRRDRRAHGLHIDRRPPGTRGGRRFSDQDGALGRSREWGPTRSMTPGESAGAAPEPASAWRRGETCPAPCCSRSSAIRFLPGGDVFDGDVHAFHVAQNAAALLLQG